MASLKRAFRPPVVAVGIIASVTVAIFMLCDPASSSLTSGDGILLLAVSSAHGLVPCLALALVATAIAFRDGELSAARGSLEVRNGHLAFAPWITTTITYACSSALFPSIIVAAIATSTTIVPGVTVWTWFACIAPLITVGTTLRRVDWKLHDKLIKLPSWIATRNRAILAASAMLGGIFAIAQALTRTMSFAANHVNSQVSVYFTTIFGTGMVVSLAVFACCVVKMAAERATKDASRKGVHPAMLAVTRASARDAVRAGCLLVFVGIAVVASSAMASSVSGAALPAARVAMGGHVRLGDPASDYASTNMTFTSTELASLAAHTPAISMAHLVRWVRDGQLVSPALASIGITFDEFGFDAAFGESVSVSIVDPGVYLATAGAESFRFTAPSKTTSEILADLDAPGTIVLQAELAESIGKMPGSKVMVRLDGLVCRATVVGVADVLPGMPATMDGDGPFYPYSATAQHYCAVMSWRAYDALVDASIPDLLIRNKFWNGSDAFVDDVAHASWGTLGLPVDRAAVASVLAPWVANGTIQLGFSSSIAGIASMRIIPFKNVEFGSGTVGTPMSLPGTVVASTSPPGSLPVVEAVSDIPSGFRGSPADILAYCDGTGLYASPCITSAVVARYLPGTTMLDYVYEVSPGDIVQVLANGTVVANMTVVATVAVGEHYAYTKQGRQVMPEAWHPSAWSFHPYRSGSGVAEVTDALLPSASAVLVSNKTAAPVWRSICNIMNGSGLVTMPDGTAWGRNTTMRALLASSAASSDSTWTGCVARVNPASDPRWVASKVEAALAAVPAMENHTARAVEADFLRYTGFDRGNAIVRLAAGDGYGVGEANRLLEAGFAAAGLPWDADQISHSAVEFHRLLLPVPPLERMSVLVVWVAAIVAGVVVVAGVPNAGRRYQSVFRLAVATRARASLRSGMWAASVLPRLAVLLVCLLVGALLGMFAFPLVWTGAPFLLSFPVPTGLVAAPAWNAIGILAGCVVMAYIIRALPWIMSKDGRGDAGEGKIRRHHYLSGHEKRYTDKTR